MENKSIIKEPQEEKVPTEVLETPLKLYSDSASMESYVKNSIFTYCRVISNP